ncbi:MAG: hypothetical protein RML92_05015 [Bacteroidia bacterium]|nr:hypothetical protein [Bacteroidia bacterium]
MRLGVWFGLFVVLLYGQGRDQIDEDFLEDIFSESSAPSDSTSRDTITSLTTAPPPLEQDTLLNPPKILPPLRLIDSPVQQYLPIGDIQTLRVSTERPFLVQLVRPKLQNSKGYPLIYGFETWYLYVVKTEQVRVDGKVIHTRSLPVYLAIVSSAESLEDVPVVLETPALMLKGIVDYGDTIVKYFKREKKRLRMVLDSLMKQPVSEDAIQAEEQERTLEKVADSLDYAEAYYELYKKLRSAKASDKGMIQFFLDFPFNRTLTYSIYSAPYALPRYEPPRSESASRRQKKRRRL